MHGEQGDTERVRVGPYLVEDVLGSGPHGTVYRVLHEEQGVPLALKRLHEPARGRPGEAFNRISKVLVALAHPMIADVRHIVMHGEHVAIITELVEGRSLAALLSQDGPLAPHEVMDIAKQLCAGMQFAHQRCVYHTSLRPDNVFVRREGGIQITDFAVAALYGNSVRHRPRYTPRHEMFFAPEFRERGIIHALSDVYSFGVVLYVLLVDDRPEEATAPGRGERFSYLELGDAPDATSGSIELDLDRLPPETPLELRRLIASAVSDDISERPASMNAVGEMLRRGGRERSQPTARVSSDARESIPEVSEPRVRTCSACGRPISPAGRVCLACGLVLRGALEQTPPIDYFHRHGRRLLTGGDPEAAERAYRRAIERHPSEPVLHNELGDLLVVNNRFDEAVKSYRAALKHAPDDADTWHDLGLALAVLKRRGAARDALGRAAERSERDEVRLSALIHLGALAADEGRTSDAVRTWLKVIGEEPGLVPVRMALASTLAGIGEYDSAQRHLRAVLSVAPETREAQNLLARIRERAQLERDEAARDIHLTDDLGGGEAYLGPGFDWRRLR